jgi:holliday junction DNA helicase RuvB
LLTKFCEQVLKYIMIISSFSDQQNPDVSKKKPHSAVVNERELIEEREELVKLRPSSFDGYIGQEAVIKQVKLIIDSAKLRTTLPEHIMFYGQPGLGKTTLAYLVSNELGGNLKTIAAPALQKVGDLVSLLVNLEPNTVLFIDEIHRLKAPLEETLYTAMEDGHVDLVMGKGQGISIGKIDLNSFVIIGATTLLGKVSKPLKDRFPTVFQLEPYSEENILDLFERNLSILGIQMDMSARLLVCRRCRGVPRIANNILKRFVDLQIVHSYDSINEQQALEFLLEMGINELGLLKTDLQYLRSLLTGSLSLKTLSGILMEDSETLEVVVEPYLIHLGFIDKSSEGRRLTLKGREFILGFDGKSDYLEGALV